MGIVGIVLATEDALSEAVAQKLIDELGPQVTVVQTLRRGGFGYLKARIGNFCEMARHQPILVITDLDRHACASELLQAWLARRRRPAQLLLRFAVREIESWVLADHEAMRVLLERENQVLPRAPDELIDPKAALIQLAKRGPRRVREAIVPEAGAIASQGLGYNQVLVPHVCRHWSPMRASQRSDSLQRARCRLHELASAVT